MRRMEVPVLRLTGADCGGLNDGAVLMRRFGTH